MRQIMSLVVVLLLSSLSLVAAEPPASRQWNFHVFLDNKEIGYHHFSLHKNADETRVTSSARFDVKVLFINAYQYAHDDQEIWRNDCLTDMTASTNDNGKRLSVTATATATGLSVHAGKEKLDLPGCVMSFAYWNTAMLRQTRLLNAQTGEYDAISIQMLGTNSVRVAGKDVTARRYQLAGKKLQIDLWYSLDGDWLALESTTENGRRLRYVLN